MSKPLVKICGMRDVGNILEVAKSLPDLMGFIFYRPSPRYVGEGFKIPSALPGSIRRVGVFVNEGTNEILELANRHALDVVQLHGDEPASDAAILKGRGLKVIKVFRVGEGFDFKILNDYESGVDHFMFDTKGQLFGGNAKTFNWKVLNEYTLRPTFFLSGGLSTENIPDALKLGNEKLFALDLNSGVEVNPGMKDISKVKRVIDLIRSED